MFNHPVTVMLLGTPLILRCILSEVCLETREEHQEPTKTCHLGVAVPEKRVCAEMRFISFDVSL